MKIIKKIGGVFCALIAFRSIFLFLTPKNANDMPEPAFIIEAIIFIFLSFLLMKKTPEEKNRQLEEKSKKRTTGTHISGLDIGKAPVYLCLSNDGLLFSVPNLKKEFNLSLSKIENLGYYDEVEIEKYLKPSLAGGIIGAATFGLAGAIIGSRPKRKQTRKTIYYLLIDYSDGQIIIESDDSISMMRMIKYFRQLKPQANETTTIEL